MTTLTRTPKEGEVECQLSDLLFDVEMRDNPMPSNSEYSKIIIGQLGGGDFFLNACSPRYELVMNTDIFPNIEGVLKANNIEFTVSYSHIDNVRFYADYVITDSRFSYRMKGSNDVINPLIRVQHSYNGLTKYRIIFGYFRFICGNGLVVAVEEMKKYNLCIVGKHTEIIRKSFYMLDEMLKFFAANAAVVVYDLTAKYEMLGGRMVDKVEDRILEVLNANKIIAVDNKKFSTVDSILRTITTEANNPVLGYQGKVNDWLVYNGINQYLFDDNRNIVAPELRMDKDSSVFEYMLAHA
ncbi:MAG: DUF932 domain-containing protein [Bacteroidales bacterium]|nr:DUF932 domain-containing protein [Bacteroidales bacterium]